MKWDSFFLSQLSENWPNTGCSWDRSELRILHLGWSQAFEESLSSQGHPQLTSSEDHFPSCSWGPTLYLCFFSFYSLSFQLQYHAISFVHTFLCILPCRIFSCELCVIEGFHVWEYPETISCLWSLIKMLIFLFCWFVSFSWLHYAACRFLVPQRGWTLYGPCTLCEGRAES